jgi:hypothetical protein
LLDRRLSDGADRALMKMIPARTQSESVTTASPSGEAKADGLDEA